MLVAEVSLNGTTLVGQRNVARVATVTTHDQSVARKPACWFVDGQARRGMAIDGLP